MKSYMIVLLFLISCANPVKWSAERDKRIIKQNTTQRPISYFDLSGELDFRNLKKLREGRYINNDPGWSCFDEKSKDETNYVEMSDKEISFYRVHILKQVMSDFSQTTKRLNGKQHSFKENFVEDWVEIDSRRCLVELKDSGQVYYVVSEKYKGGHALWEQ